MGASRYMAVEEHTDELSGVSYAPGDFVSGRDYARMGDPAAFRGADYPEDVAALRAEHGLDDEPDGDDGDDLDLMTVEELRALAAERQIEGRSTMTKAELVAAVRGQ